MHPFVEEIESVCFERLVCAMIEIGPRDLVSGTSEASRNEA